MNLFDSREKAIDKIITNENEETFDIENLADIVKAQDVETAIRMLIENMKRQHVQNFTLQQACNKAQQEMQSIQKWKAKIV